MSLSCRKEEEAITWYDAASALPPGWDELLPEGHFLRKDTLLAHERTALPHVRTVYAARKGPGGLTAMAAFQVLALQQEHINTQALKGWQQLLWQWFSRGFKPRLLVAGQLFRHDISSFYHAPSLSPFEAFNSYRDMISAALKKQSAHAVLVKEPPASLVPYFQHYAPEYLLLRNDSSMQLRLPQAWQSMSDYEKSLKHKYAQRFRKVRQAWDGLDVRELDAAAVSASSARIYELYLQVTRNQPVRLGMLSRQFLPELKSYYGDSLKVWGIYELDRMIAFASAWVHDDHFDMFYIGFDYERNADLNLYFNILFFAIEQSIRLRKPQLILGRTALEAKARVGCRPEYLNTFLYIRNGLLRNIVGRLQQRFSEPSGEWENRHPFKKELPAS